jgi:phosphoribosyl 1,2-cyclic phosphodiesterase
MKIKFWGVRGSYPVPGLSTNKYGGNTPCVQVTLDSGSIIILDAGTGIRPLGQALMQNGFGSGKGQANILITHTHWDHIQGFPFFAPAFIGGNRFTIHARASSHRHLREILAYQNEEYFSPVPFQAMKADLKFVEIEADQTFKIEDAVVTTFKLNHPNVAIGYRIVADGKVFAYVTDTAPFEDVLIGDAFIPKPPDKISDEDQRQLEELQMKLNTVLQNADFIVYDAFFRMDEYMKNPHWGHSTPEHGIDLCHKVGVKRLALFHHAPSNTDETMAMLEDYYQTMCKAFGLEVMVAMEGKEITL